MVVNNRYHTSNDIDAAAAVIAKYLSSDANHGPAIELQKVSSYSPQFSNIQI